MNINFKKIRYKNILSTGNVFTEIVLNRSKTTLISGLNGSGKSTLVEAIVFSLYGKPFRNINKPQLVNTINQKDLLVEIEFSIGSNEYLVRRGIKPTIFEIYCNGKLVDQEAASKDYQAYLEQNILNLNYKSFSQIVVLGSAKFVPFMELPAQSRREIIEDLLDIQVFSTMNLLLKDRINENKNSISDVKHQIDLTKMLIENSKEHRDSIRKIHEDEILKIKEKIKNQVKIVEEEKILIRNIETEIKELLSKIKDKEHIKSELDKAKTLKLELDSTLKSCDKEINFYHNNDNCPTCKQSIDDKFKKTVIAETDKKISEVSEKVAEIEKNISTLKSRLEEIYFIEVEIQQKNVEIGEHKAQIRMSMSALNEYKNELDTEKKQVENSDKSKIAEYEENLKIQQNNQKRLFDERETLSIISTMLKDGGIKTRIIRQYVPIMNNLINKHLSAFDLFVNFELDENFNEVIKSRFRDTFSYDSFSEGEKLRINLSIMLTWRSIAKLRNSVSTNLLILDETLDGAMDGAGVENLIDTLHNLNNNDNIFVISHRGDQFGDKFESFIRFEKNKNFSQIAT